MNKSLKIIVADITTLEVDAIVNAANSTGVYGYPKQEAARIALNVIFRHLQSAYQGEVIVCCFSEADKQIYENALKEYRE